jgi:hypothetical protein
MRAPVALIASLLIANVSMDTMARSCGGWKSSHEAHERCCAMAQHDCGGERADECCASGEERQHGESSRTSPAVTYSILAPIASTADSLAPQPLSILDDSLDRARSSTPARLLACVFLI